MAARPAKTLFPDWHMEISEALENQTALNLDSLKATHPIHVSVDTPSEIESVFDPISYEKGASVLRMVESYVGEDAFRAGVNAYIEKHAYSNATAEDFFQALTDASGKPVDRVMGTFVLQAGVPELDVTTACANGRTSLTLTQRRLSLGSAPSDERERWQIPVCLKAAGADRSSCLLLTEPTATMPVGDRCARWVFANAGGRGYYRSVYTPDAITAMAPDVETALSAPERLSLVSDEWALVRAGRHAVANYLDLVSGFGHEPMAQVLGVATDKLGFIDEYLTTPSNRASFRSFVRSLLQPAYQQTGFDRQTDDSEDRRSLRDVIVGVLGGIAEDADVVASARSAVAEALRGAKPLDPILAGTLVNIAAAHGDAALFDALARAAEHATSPEEHYRYLYALTSFKDPALIQRALELSLSPVLRSQDTALYVASLFGNDAARDPAWAFIKAHWTELEPKVTIALGDLNLARSLSAFCSSDARDDIKRFFSSHPLPTGERALQQTFERIENCAAMRQRQQPSLNEWLAARP
jgi:aminopeptidase N/puromycin-sensitive aminopeptidase